jgi:putative oxidoreductase
MKCLKKFYEALIYSANFFQHPFLLAIRLYWGYSFFQTGWGKLNNIGVVTEYFRTLNIPLPFLNAYAAATVECFGGILLLLGLGSRLVAIPLAFTMVIALLTTLPNGLQTLYLDPDTLISQKPFTYLFASLVVFAFGPGLFSVDAGIKSLVFKKNLRNPSA